MCEGVGVFVKDASFGGREAVVTVFIMDEMGLHARPAARLAQAAGAFRADIRLRCEDREADARSILEILALAAGRGASLTVICRGDDAANAAATLSGLFDEPLMPQGAASPVDVRTGQCGRIEENEKE